MHWGERDMREQKDKKRKKQKNEGKCASESEKGEGKKCK
jgi:hypothetical protein